MEFLRKIDFRVGTIVAVKPNTKARNPSFIVDIDLGNLIGKKTTSAQLPANYRQEDLLREKQVICVVNFPVKRIAGFKSEVLVVGFPDDQSNVILLNTRGLKTINGTKVFYHGQLDISSTSVKVEEASASSVKQFDHFLPETTYEDFSKANIIVGTITGIETANVHEGSLTIDFGEKFGVKKLSSMQISSGFIYDLPTQVAASIDETKNEIVPLFVTQNDSIHDIVLIGVDRNVPNGGKLF